jgi:uridine phosphorylase
MKPRVTRRLGALAPKTRAGTIAGAKAAAAAAFKTLRREHRFFPSCMDLLLKKTAVTAFRSAGKRRLHDSRFQSVLFAR